MGSVLSRFTSRKDETNAATTANARPTGIRKRWSWRSTKKPADITVNAATTVNRSSTLPARPRLQVNEEDPEHRRHDDIFDEEQTQQQQQQPKVDSNNNTTVKPSSESETISQQLNEQHEQINVVECTNKSLVQKVPEVKDVEEQHESEGKADLKTSISIEEADLLMTHVLPKEENEPVKEQKKEDGSDGGVLPHPDSNAELVENLKNDTGVMIQPQQEMNKSQEEELNDIIEHSLKQEEDFQLDENKIVHEIIEEPVEQSSVTAIPFEGKEEEFLEEEEEEIRKHENIVEQKIVDNEIVEHMVVDHHPVIPENIQSNESIQSQVDECYSNPGLAYTPSPDQLVTSLDANLNETVNYEETENDLKDAVEVTAAEEQHNILHQMMEHSDLVESLYKKSNSPGNLSNDEIFLINEPIEKQNENSLNAMYQESAEQSVPPHELGDVKPTESLEEMYAKEAEKILDDISTTENITQEEEIQETVQDESVTNLSLNQSVPPHETIDIKSTESTEELYTKQSEEIIDSASAENIRDEDILQEVVQNESATNWLPNECVSQTPDVLDAKYAEVIEEMYIGHAENIIDEVFTKNLESDIVHEKIASDPLVKCLTEPDVVHELLEFEPTEVDDEIFIKEDENIVNAVPSESFTTKDVLEEGGQDESTEQSMPVDVIPTESIEEMYTKQAENIFGDVPSENIANKDVLEEGVQNESTEQTVPVDAIPTESIEEMYTKQPAENIFDDVPSENIANKDVLEEGVQNESVNWSTEQSLPPHEQSIEEVFMEQKQQQQQQHQEPQDIIDKLITENIDKDIVVQEEMTSIQSPEYSADPLLNDELEVKEMNKEEQSIEETLEDLMHQEFLQNELIGEQIQEQIMSSDELQHHQQQQSLPDTTPGEEKVEANEDQVEMANQMKVSLDNNAIAEDTPTEEVVSNTEASEHLPESSITTEESIDNMKLDLESAYTTANTATTTYNTEIAGINHDLMSSDNQHVNSTENLYIHDNNNNNKESSLPSADAGHDDNILMSSNQNHPTEIDDKNHVVVVEEEEVEADKFIQSVLQTAQEHVWNENHINDQLQYTPTPTTPTPTIPTPASLTPGSLRNSMNSLLDNNNDNNNGVEVADGIATDENILKVKKLGLNQSSDLIEQDQSVELELNHNNLTNNSNGSHHIL